MFQPRQTPISQHSKCCLHWEMLAAVPCPNATQFAVCGQEVTLAQYIIHKCLASRCYLRQILGAMISDINGSALLVVPNVTTHSSKSSIPTLCYLSHGQSINQSIQKVLTPIHHQHCTNNNSTKKYTTVNSIWYTIYRQNTDEILPLFSKGWKLYTRAKKVTQHCSRRDRKQVSGL